MMRSPPVRVRITDGCWTTADGRGPTDSFPYLGRTPGPETLRTRHLAVTPAGRGRSPFRLVGGRDFCGRKLPGLDLADGARAFPGGEPQRLVRPGLDPGADFPALVVDADDLLVVDPATDH